MATAAVNKPMLLRDTADSLRVSVLFLLALTVVQRGIGFVRKFLFCSWMAPDELGQWDIAFGFLTLAAALAVMGIPGALLRFAEHFRQRGHLRTYVWNTAIATGLLGGLVTTLLLLLPSTSAQLFFGGREFERLVVPVALTLAATVAFNAVMTLFTALRLQRIRSLLTAAYALLFTVLGSGLLLLWKPTAESVIVAHCLSLAACFCLGAYWIWNSSHIQARDAVATEGGGFYAKVMPFAMAVWVTNGLANLLPFLDRYMILTFSGQPAEQAYSIVGQYHVARLIPVFVFSLAQMLQATLLPYLCHDWELGNREKVNDRLDSFLRLFGLAFFAASALFLTVGPWLLTYLFGDKYEAGLAVLNLTLMHGVFASLFVITQSYLWCDEQGWLVNLGLLIALLVNAGLNLLLLPRFGLQGAAIASCVGIVTLLLYVIYSSWLRGMRFQVATGIVATLPLSFIAGPYLGLIVLGGATVVAISSDVLLTHEDKRQAAELARRFGDFVAKRRS